MPTVLLDSYENFTAHLEDREFFGTKLGLTRIQGLLARLGNPEKKFPSIHIAGTNGKGSTAAMIAQILAEAGYKVGLYTSPHLVDFCERIRVAGEVIPRTQVLHYARLIHESETEPLTFFELATAIGFLHFAEGKVDIAVVEVGIGGRLDATNVITPLVSVITTIGLDHTDHLGNSVEKIAFEKGGIIKPRVPVVVGPLSAVAMGVIRREASCRNAPLIELSYGPGACERVARDEAPAARTVRSTAGVVPSQDPLPANFRINLPGDHQLQNAAVAVKVVELLREQNGFSVGEEAIRRGLENVHWPGRLETVQENPWILLDGAHNPQAMAAVRQFLEPRLNGRKLKVIFGAMADKDLPGLLAEIAPITDEFIFTAPAMRRAASPAVLAELAATLGKKGRVTGSVEKALRLGKGSLGQNDALLVTGSLFVVGEVRRMLIPPS